MKATDLMMWDWVMDLGPVYIDAISNEDVCTYRSETGYYTVNPSNLKPIPLTPEILEKNGFFVKHPDSEKRQYWRDSTGQIVVHKNRGYFLFNISGNAFKFGFFVPQFSAHLRYIHELQHALKLCGIDKEIKL